MITQVKRFENQTKKKNKTTKRIANIKKTLIFLNLNLSKKSLKTMIKKNKSNKKNDKSKSFRDVINSNHILIFTKFKNINFISRLFR